MSIQSYFASSNVRTPVKFSARVADLALVAGVVAIVALMILPMPVLIIDLLVGVNITFGVLLLMNTLYIRGALDFSAFPSILLVSTLFRLALSIATTRMILTTGHAGHIIQTFGKMVVGGNIVVGLVVFLIITVVQFIVIAKGAERVAEVAARFSLDSMPGKQLSIDSDLRSGLIDKDDARRRRRVLELESKLHGSLDGAMKFVKGDAIASIVIVVINLIGGLAIGVMQQGMDLGAATHKYSILTIGEGLVAQIPALLGAMAAGLMVTRTTDEEQGANLGEAIHRQLSSNPRVLIFVGLICFLLACVPGFPALVFLALGLGALLSGAGMHPRLQPYVMRYGGPLQKMLVRRPPPPPATLLAAPEPPRPVVPLLLEHSGPHPGEAAAHALGQALTEMLDRLQYRTGVPLPRLAIHFTGAGAGWRLLAFEVPIGAAETPDRLVEAVEQLLRRNLSLFLGVQEAVELLNKIGDDYPEVVKEAVRAVPAARIAEILRRLAEEEVPIRNMRDVLEGITAAAALEREPARIADHVRVALKRTILDAHAVDGVIRALAVSPDLEAMVRDRTRLIDGVERLALEPDFARDLVGTIGATATDTNTAVLVAAFDVRRALRKLIEPSLFDLPVLAFNELSPAVRFEMVGQIGLPAGMIAAEPASIAAE
ncbi:FHIPEP family type III secretion protein [Sphingomonas sp. AP4-R1]|uniref:flagellar biosynthesis protein FlhA n=1 Tax=Sphingomonas sp. AP4-R1 TaxID=2735134 RepID=UPI001493B00C|nr:flagellar biosynthesis protein FlhA [Sphingomonas sp. AP4-R1]QJU59899.1 FHIPEP family type III secretion protein [Sphingomonas sp. AP4-R1]